MKIGVFTEAWILRVNDDVQGYDAKNAESISYKIKILKHVMIDIMCNWQMYAIKIRKSKFINYNHIKIMSIKYYFCRAAIIIRNRS